jgi:hypothetical protein
MSQKLKNLYTHLIQNRKHNLIGWYNEYKKFSEDIDKISANLATLGLRDNATYVGTSFEKAPIPLMILSVNYFLKRQMGSHHVGNQF